MIKNLILLFFGPPGKCFQYAVTVALKRDKINKQPQRVFKIKPFIDQYNWNDIDFPSTGKD